MAQLQSTSNARWERTASDALVARDPSICPNPLTHSVSDRGKEGDSGQREVKLEIKSIEKKNL